MTIVVPRNKHRGCQKIRPIPYLLRMSIERIDLTIFYQMFNAIFRFHSDHVIHGWKTGTKYNLVAFETPQQRANENEQELFHPSPTQPKAPWFYCEQNRRPCSDLLKTNRLLSNRSPVPLHYLNMIQPVEMLLQLLLSPCVLLKSISFIPSPILKRLTGQMPIDLHHTIYPIQTGRQIKKGESINSVPLWVHPCFLYFFGIHICFLNHPHFHTMGPVMHHPSTASV